MVNLLRQDDNIRDPCEKINHMAKNSKEDRVLTLDELLRRMCKSVLKGKGDLMETSSRSLIFCQVEGVSPDDIIIQS